MVHARFLAEAGCVNYPLAKGNALIEPTQCEDWEFRITCRLHNYAPQANEDILFSCLLSGRAS
jgi:hypothetical protein